jgi:hypothetical protein
MDEKIASSDLRKLAQELIRLGKMPTPHEFVKMIESARKKTAEGLNFRTINSATIRPKSTHSPRTVVAVFVDPSIILASALSRSRQFFPSQVVEYRIGNLHVVAH